MGVLKKIWIQDSLTILAVRRKYDEILASLTTFRITYIVSKPCNRAKLCTIHLKILTEISTTNGTKAIALVPFVSCSKYKILIVFSARFIWQFQDTCQQLARQGHWLCERHLRILHPIEWRISDCFGRHERF